MAVSSALVRVLGTALSSGLMARFDYEMILTKMMMMMIDDEDDDTYLVRVLGTALSSGLMARFP